MAFPEDVSKVQLPQCKVIKLTYRFSQGELGACPSSHPKRLITIFYGTHRYVFRQAPTFIDGFFAL